MFIHALDTLQIPVHSSKLNVLPESDLLEPFKKSFSDVLPILDEFEQTETQDLNDHEHTVGSLVLQRDREK